MTLVYLGFGWLVGLVWAMVCPLKWPIWLALTPFPITAAWLQRNDRRYWRISLAVCFSLFGAARCQAFQPQLDLAQLNGQGRVTLEGYVAEEPAAHVDTVQIIIQVERIALEGPRRIAGRVLVEAPLYPEYHYGDRLSIAGRLQAPAAGSYQKYLAVKGIYSIIRQPRVELLDGKGGSWIKRGLMKARGVMQARIDRILPDPEAALLSGILLGNDQRISRSLLDKFNATGATHVIAISGANISLFIALLLKGFGRVVPRKTAGLLTLAAIAAYTVLVGADPPVVRAALMGGLLTSGWLLGRQPFGPTSLAAAAFFMTCANPMLVRDVGFQLSFAATLGLMLYPEPFQDLEKSGRRGRSAVKRAIRLLGDYALLIVTAQLATLPLIAYHFGRVPSISVLTNLLMLWAQPLLMATGGAALMVGLLWLPLGHMAAWFCYPFLWWTIRAVEWTDGLAGGSVETNITVTTVVSWYAFLLGLVWLISRRKSIMMWRPLSTRALSYACLVSAGICLLVAVTGIRNLPDGRLHVIFWDVGSGEAIFIETPGGRRVLVDGGQDSSLLLDRLGRRMSLWDRSLDLVIATHDDFEHIGGLPAVLKSYQAGALVTNGQVEGSTTWARLMELAEENGIRQAAVVRGQTIRLGDGVTFFILNPDGRPGNDRDNSSVVFRIDYMNTSFLMTADIDSDIEADMIENNLPLRSVVLKAADGGGKSGTGRPFLEAVDPWVVVIPVSEENNKNQPARTVLDRLEQFNKPVARTDESGSIHFITDGRYLWMEAESK